MLINLISNAIKFTTEGYIRFGYELRGKEIYFYVSDTGCGIPATLRERVFDPFFSTKPSGTGLGMAIARRIVEGHQGSIEIDSVEGQGSSVTLILPVAQDKRET